MIRTRFQRLYRVMRRAGFTAVECRYHAPRIVRAAERIDARHT